MNENILLAQGVCKSYGDNQVLHNLDLSLEPGKIYGLIGRNGAGKTTLLSILTAQNTMDSGSVTYGGEPVWENQRALDRLCFSRELQPTLMTGSTPCGCWRSSSWIRKRKSPSCPRARCPWSPSSSPWPAGPR